MYQGMKKIEEVIDYIEAHLTETLDYTKMASIMNLSLYEFRRIFAFIVGCPLSEYIRRRRLSLAACEIAMGDGGNLQRISEKYGYSTQAAFTRAFTEQHGISPSAYRKQACEIKLFTRPRLEWSVSGRERVPFSILKDRAYAICGFCADSPLTDTCCCEEAWSAFYESGTDRSLSSELLFVSYRNRGETVRCTIGTQLLTEPNNDTDTDSTELIPASHWACFRLRTTDDDAVNRLYEQILCEWLPAAGLKRATGVPTVEIFPSDMSKEGFEWEIRIPIEESNR